MAEYKGFFQLSETGNSYLLLCEQKLKVLKVIDITVFGENPVEKCAETINNFLSSSGIPNDDFSLSITIPPEGFSYRYFVLPQLKGKKLEDVVRFEWMRQFPFNEGDAEIKFVPVFKKEKTFVSGFLVKKEFIEKITTPFLQRKIYIESIVPESYTLFTFFPFPLVIVGLNSNRTSSISIIGEKETTILTFCGSEKSLIRSFLRIYRSKWGELPDRVFVYGEDNNVSEILEEFGLKLLTYTMPDYIEFNQPLNLEEQKKILPAIGLAGIVINGLEHPEFSKPEFKSPLKMRNINTIYLSTCIAGVVFLIIFTISSFLHFYHYKKEYQKTSSEITAIFKKSFPDVENVVDPLTQMKEKLTLLRARGKTGKGKLIEFIKALKEDASSAGDVKITEMLFEGGKIILKGQTFSISSIDSFEKKLRERKFREVRLTKTQKSLKEEMYEFEMSVEQ